MGDSAKAEKTKTKAPKKSWFDGLKSEFHKIIWPDKTELGKETLAAVSYTHLQFSLATAVGLLKSVIGFLMISLSYLIAYKKANYRIF